MEIGGKIMYKEYMLRCSVYEDGDSEDPDAWEEQTLYFDTEKEMKDHVRNHSYAIRVIAAFKLTKLDNNIFV